jgi:hypothetical protein
MGVLCVEGPLTLTLSPEGRGDWIAFGGRFEQGQKSPLIRPLGTFSLEGRRGASSLDLHRVSLLPLREKVDRAQRETDEGVLS